nr:four helix bundle protein [Luteibacter jiangsuensis]
MSRPHHRLLVWQRAMKLAHRIYVLTRELPEDERFGLVSQLRRAAVSVPSNIAEGACRGSRKEMERFLMIARGSLGELDTQLRLAGGMEMADVDSVLFDVEQLFALMGGLARKLRAETDGSQAARRRLTSRVAAD